MFVPIRIIIRQDFPQLLLSTNSEKNLLIWMLMSLKKKVCFYHLFWYEERQERRNHEPAVSLRRPGSAEQAQFFARKEEYKKRKAKPAVPCTYTNLSSYFSPRHRRRLQQTWFYVEATFSPKKWRLQVNICFYSSETFKKVIYLNVNKSLQLFWCFKCVCGQVL